MGVRHIGGGVSQFWKQGFAGDTLDLILERCILVYEDKKNILKKKKVKV